MILISAYNGVSDTIGVTVPIEAAGARILSGKRRLDETTRLLNALAETDPEAYKKEKLKLPAATWSGTFKGRKELIQHSGYVVLDFDEIDIGTLKTELMHHPNAFFAFVSPSGRGVKAVIPVHPIPTTAQEHKYAFRAVCDAFEHLAEIDPSGSDVTRLCFLAYDPRAIENPEATPITWHPPEADTTQQTHKQTPIAHGTVADISQLKIRSIRKQTRKRIGSFDTFFLLFYLLFNFISRIILYVVTHSRNSPLIYRQKEYHAHPAPLHTGSHEPICRGYSLYESIRATNKR